MREHCFTFRSKTIFDFKGFELLINEYIMQQHLNPIEKHKSEIEKRISQLEEKFREVNIDSNLRGMFQKAIIRRESDMSI